VIDVEHPSYRLRRMIFEEQRDSCAGDREACDYWLQTYVASLKLPEPQVVIVEPPQATGRILELGGVTVREEPAAAEESWCAECGRLIGPDKGLCADCEAVVPPADVTEPEPAEPVAPQPLDEAPRKGKR
jgi:hypothetical protein